MEASRPTASRACSWHIVHHEHAVIRHLRREITAHDFFTSLISGLYALRMSGTIWLDLPATFEKKSSSISSSSGSSFRTHVLAVRDPVRLRGHQEHRAKLVVKSLPTPVNV